MKLFAGRNSLMVTVPIAAAGLLYLMLVFLPGMKAINELRGELNTQRDFIAQSAQIPAAVRQVQSELEALSHFVDAWESNSPEGLALEALFGRINAATKLAGAEPLRFEPQPKINYQSIRQAPLVMEVRGSFAAVAKLVAQIESLPPTVWIEQLKIERPKEAGKAATCELRLAVFSDNLEKSDEPNPAADR